MTPRHAGAAWGADGATPCFDPVDFLYAEHERQRGILDRLCAIASGPQPEPAEARALLLFLEVDLRLHFLDEEGDLFPRLHRCCSAADGVADRLAHLSEDHHRDTHLAREISAGLRSLVGGARIEAVRPNLQAVARFAETHRDHIEMENTTILPLARRRLDAGERAALARALAWRHGLAGSHAGG